MGNLKFRLRPPSRMRGAAAAAVLAAAAGLTLGSLGGGTQPAVAQAVPSPSPSPTGDISCGLLGICPSPTPAESPSPSPTRSSPRPTHRPSPAPTRSPVGGPTTPPAGPTPTAPGASPPPGPGAPSPQPRATSIELVSDPPSPGPGTAATLTVTVSAVRGNDRFGVSGAIVDFSLTTFPDTDASLSPTEVITDDSGTADTSLVLSKRPGRHVIQATSGNLSVTLELDTLTPAGLAPTRARHLGAVYPGAAAIQRDATPFYIAAMVILAVGWLAHYRPWVRLPATPPPGPALRPRGEVAAEPQRRGRGRGRRDRAEWTPGRATAWLNEGLPTTTLPSSGEVWGPRQAPEPGGRRRTRIRRIPERGEKPG